MLWRGSTDVVQHRQEEKVEEEILPLYEFICNAKTYYSLPTNVIFNWLVSKTTWKSHNTRFTKTFAALQVLFFAFSLFVWL